MSWTAPDNQNDYINIVPVGSKKNARGNYRYARDGSPLEHQTIDRAGAYELRYISAVSGDILATRPITLTAPVVSLQAPAEAVADAGTSINHAYIRNGDPADLLTAAAPGDYEIRYVSGQSRATWASNPLSVVAE